jgi:hypothetical protein
MSHVVILTLSWSKGKNPRILLLPLPLLSGLKLATFTICASRDLNLQQNNPSQ